MLRRLKSLSLLLLLLHCAATAQNKPTVPPKPIPEVEKLIDEGVKAIQEHKWQLAVTTFEKAVELARKANDHVGEATALALSGNVYGDLSQPRKAVEYFQQALPLFRQVGSKHGEAVLLGNLGNVYSNLGQPQKALEHYQRALPMLQQSGDIGRVAKTLNNIGNIYANIGQPQKASEYFQQALPLFRQIGNKGGEALTLTNVGNVYGDLSQPLKAVEYFQQALQLYRASNDKRGEANALICIGNIYIRIQQPQKALECYEQALPLYKVSGDRQSEVMVNGNLGLVYANTDQPKKALEYYKQALLFYKASSNRNAEAGVLNNIGNVYIRIRQPQKALEYYKQALPLYKASSDKRKEADILNNMGAVYANMGHPQKAVAFYFQSLAAHEMFRRSIGGSIENRQDFLSSIMGIYGRLLCLLTDLHQDAHAFAVLQSGKGRSLLDQSIRTQCLLAVLPADQQATLHQLGRELDKQSLTVTALEIRIGKTDKEKEQQEAARKALGSAERALQREQDRLSALHPVAWATAKTVPLAETARFLPSDTALLDYAAVKVEITHTKKWDQHFLFVVTVENGKPVLTVHSIPVTAEVMAERVDSLRDACADPEKRYRVAAQELAAKLLPPAVMKRIAGKKRLVICPDGAIWNVPFAALVLPNGKHLLEQYELDYAYSASSVQQAANVKRGNGQGTLVVANPAFGDETRFGLTVQADVPTVAQSHTDSNRQRPLWEPARGGFTARGGLAALPGTAEEATTLSRLFAENKIFIGADAQESAVVKELPKYRYLHFATHGVVSDTSPMQSAIVLAVPSKDSEDDGFLTAREIMSMKLNAEMAVLSACETARGEIKAGEGVVGLTWALSVAGVPTQVVSQWKISDNSTPLLMKHFYGNLKGGQKKGQALRNAALAMMKDGKHAHPYHWASFVLFGDWR